MKKYILLTVLFFWIFVQKNNAQSSSASTTFSPSNYLGWSTGAQSMTLRSGGDLNIVGTANGYQIGTKQVLYTGGDPTSIFVGGQVPFLI